MKNKYIERIYNGVIKENPTLILMLGMCPTLAVSTRAMNGIGMGLSTTAVLILSNLVISLLRKVIPNQVRLPSYIVSRPYAFTKYSIIQQARASGIPVYKRIPRPVLVLTVIAAIAGLALSGVYGMTKDIIADQQRAAQTAPPSARRYCPRASTPSASSYSLRERS